MPCPAAPPALANPPAAPGVRAVAGVAGASAGLCAPNGEACPKAGVEVGFMNGEAPALVGAVALVPNGAMLGDAGGAPKGDGAGATADVVAAVAFCPKRGAGVAAGAAAAAVANAVSGFAPAAVIAEPNADGADVPLAGANFAFAAWACCGYFFANESISFSSWPLYLVKILLTLSFVAFAGCANW